jgi:hypothetical protein
VPVPEAAHDQHRPTPPAHGNEVRARQGFLLVVGLVGCNCGEPGLGQDLEPEVAAASAHSSCCSASTAPTKRMTAPRSGKILTLSVRRRISRLSRSAGCWTRSCAQVEGQLAAHDDTIGEVASDELHDCQG